MKFNRLDDHNVRVELVGDGSIQFDIQVPFGINTEFDEKQFTAYFFAKKELKENDIFQVYQRESASRLGWMIPITALFSKEHDFADDIHFRRYAYQAIKQCTHYLVSNVLDETGLNNLQTNSIGSFFHDSICILIISLDCLKENSSLSIYRRFPSMLVHGYVPLSERDPEEIHFEGVPPAGKRIHTSEISTFVEDVEFINRILAQSLAYEKEPAFQFFYLYQIIEFMISEVSSDRLDTLIEKLSLGRNDTQVVRDCMTEVGEVLSEEKRIGILCNEYCDLERSRHEELKRISNIFLRECGYDFIGSFNEYVYKIRNLVFHQYRKLPSDENVLRDVVREAVPVIVYLLAAYNPER